MGIRTILALVSTVLAAAGAGAATAAVPTIVPAAADTAWSLARCEQAALAASPGLAAARAYADGSRAGADAADAAHLPVLGLQGSAGYVTETMTLEVPTATGIRHLEFGDGTSAELALGLRAPLYTGGRLGAERRAAAAGWRASLADAAGDSLDLRLQVRQAYFAALGGEAAAAAARQGEQRLRRHLAELEADLAVGTASEEARLQVLARLRRTEQATLRAEADAAARRYHLGRLVGLPGRQVRPGGDLDATLLSADPEGRPWAERHRLQAVTARADAAGHAARAAAGSFLPTVELQGGWHYGRPGVDPVANRWMDYGTVGVSLGWTLFDFGVRKSRVQGLRAERRALSAVRNDVEDALRTREANARTQVEAVRAEAERARERMDLEERRLAMAQGRWRAGHATGSEVLDAQDDVTLAATDLAAARARLRLAEAELLAALGW
ncbi:MAG: TolC family protein [Candidatus Krumholzibacteriia bacterium]